MVKRKQYRHQVACAFCGEIRDLTREHAWGAWLGRLLPEDDSVSHFVTSGDDSWMPPQHRKSIPPRRVNGPTKSIKYKIVCGDCNNGWMSRLENETKSIIERLMDESATITIDQCDLQTLARWADKTAIVNEVGGSTGVVSTPEQRRTFINLDGADPRSEIWMGTFEDPRGPLRKRHYFWGDPGIPPVTRQDAMVVGPIVFLVVNSVDDNGAGYTFEFDESEHTSPYWVKIWPSPPDKVHWPLMAMNYRQYFFVAEERHWMTGLVQMFGVPIDYVIISAKAWAALTPTGRHWIPYLGWRY